MKISLPDVTLISISSVKLEDTLSMLKKSCENIDFKEVVLVSHNKPEDFPENFIFRECEEIKTINKYNYIAFKELYKYVFTPFCLVIQPDSCVINPGLWEDNWLNYDYIGAPWVYSWDAYICPDTREHVRVGNGGFSLRSKKIIEIPEKYNLPLLEEQGWYNEDGNICVYHRKKMIDLGIKYAPTEVAAKFSFETCVPENKGLFTFGFHKNFPTKGIIKK